MNRVLIAPLIAALMSTCVYAQGQFHPEDVERMKAWAMANAGSKGGDYDCLVTLNYNMKKLYDDPGLRLGSTVDLTMSALQRQGLAGETITHNFFDKNGRRTTGVTKPEKLQESVWDRLLEVAGPVKGWSMFGLSPLDGNHSVVLALDTRGDQPTVFWSDQWGTKKGWKEYPSKEALDGEIENLTSTWWSEKLSELKVKFKSRCRIYPLIPRRTPRLNTAIMNRVSHLRMRSGPGTSFDQVVDADGNKRYFHKDERFKVLDREGRWVKLELPGGGEAWGHEAYMALIHQPEVIEEVVVTASRADANRAGGALGGLPE